MSINRYDKYPISWMPAKSRITRPINVSLMQAIEEDITTGILIPGMRLPSQRELADYLDINFTTVTKVYKRCEQKGLLHGVVGSGTFIANNATSKITISRNKMKYRTIDLAFVSSIDEIAEKTLETIKSTFQLKYLSDLLNYNEPTGMKHHKQIAAEWFERFGIDADPSNIVITSGAQNALALCALGLFDAGDTIAVDEYTYPNFISLARMKNISLISVENDNEGMIPDALSKVCEKYQIEGLFLMPSCSNPTGIMMSEERKEALSNIAKRERLLVIEDDIHAFLTAGFVEKEYRTIYSRLPDQTIYISGLSKPLYSGLRVAFVIVPDPFIHQFNEAMFNVNVKTSSLEAEIAVQLINNSDLLGEIWSRKKTVLEHYHGVFNEIFPEITVEGHPFSFYVWIQVTDNIQIDFENFVLDHGVRVFHSDRFLVGSARQDKKYLRVSFGSVKSEQELRTGLLILKECLNNYSEYKKATTKEL